MSTLNNQRGLISLLATIIISLLLTVIVVSMVGVMALLQRQASDNTDSIRAYYAAEAGIEDGILKVENALANGTLSALNTAGCNDSGTSLTGGAEYTCQQFSDTANEVTGTLTADGEPLQLDLSGLAFSLLQINWNLPGKDSPGGFAGPSGNFPQPNAPMQSVWSYPAVLELITASFPSGGGTVNTYTNVIEPTAIQQFDITTYNRGGTGLDRGYCTATTTPDNPYNCAIYVASYNSSNNYVVRLKSRYAGTHYQIQACSIDAAPCPAGDIVPIPDQMETIDVTAKVGDAYRRLVEKVPVTSGVANLDYVLFADNTICKNFSADSSTSPQIVNTCP